MPGMQWGVARADITPPVGVTLMGYDPRISTHVGHPLRAEALACDSGRGGWILLTADVCAFTAPLTDRVRAAVAQQTGLPPDAVMVAATHTHSGPHVTDALWCERSELESAYFAELGRTLVDTAVRAWAARAPGELVQARTTAPDLASNRRAQQADGTWINVWSDPDGCQTGYYDATVELVGVRRPDGRLAALLVNYGCHPVCFGSQSLAISGDYVSYLKDALEADGTVGTVLFTVAGHGNVDPRHGVQADPAVVQDMGRRLADLVAKALPDLTPVGGAGAGAVREPWSFETTWEIGGRMLIYFPHAAKGARVETALVALAAGDLALLGMPGEIVSEYRSIIEPLSPFKRTLLVSVVNDFVGYLPTDAILAEGAYEARMSPVRPIQAALTAKAQAALDRVRAAAGPVA